MWNHTFKVVVNGRTRNSQQCCSVAVLQCRSSAAVLQQCCSVAVLQKADRWWIGFDNFSSVLMEMEWMWRQLVTTCRRILSRSCDWFSAIVGKSHHGFSVQLLVPYNSHFHQTISSNEVFKHLSLKVPTIKCDVSVPVDSMQLWFLTLMLYCRKRKV